MRIEKGDCTVQFHSPRQTDAFISTRDWIFLQLRVCIFEAIRLQFCLPHAKCVKNFKPPTAIVASFLYSWLLSKGTHIISIIIFTAPVIIKVIDRLTYLSHTAARSSTKQNRTSQLFCCWLLTSRGTGIGLPVPAKYRKL